MNNSSDHPVSDGESAGVPLPDPNDPFCIHEALHMASFLVRAVDGELADHPTIRAHPELLDLAEAAVVALADLYQKIGGLQCADEALPERIDAARAMLDAHRSPASPPDTAKNDERG